MLKKVTLTILSLLVLLFTAVPSAKATSTWYNQTWPEFYGKVYSDATPPSEIFGERYTAAQVQWVYYSLVSMIFNLVLPPTTVMAVMTSDISGIVDENSVNSPDIAQAKTQESKSFWESLTEDRPLSGITYVKDVGRKLNIVKEANAQQPGFGYNALEMVKNLWTASRNTSYVFFIISAIVLAFMVMFRFKVGPQTVVTVQSSIPKLAMAMVFATFSYAIAGFMIDLLYVVIGLIAMIYNSAFGFQTPLGDRGSIYTFMINGPTNAAGVGTGLLGALILYSVTFCLGLIAAIYNPQGLLHSPTGLLQAFAAAIFSPMINSFAFVISLVVILLLIWVLMKTTWMMLKTFASVLVKVILAPIQIALGVIVPGMGFGAWFKGLVADLAVFPFIAGALVLAFIFLIQGIYVALGTRLPSYLTKDLLGDLNITQQSQTFNLANYNTNWPPILGGGSSLLSFLFIIISLVVVFSINKAADIIKGYITGRPLGYGVGVGEAMAPVVGTAAAAYGSYKSGSAASIGSQIVQGTPTFWGRVGGAMGVPGWNEHVGKSFVRGFFGRLQK